MSYIPPHKRHSKDPTKPTPVPDSLVTKFKKNLDFKSSTSSVKRNKIIYSGDSISKWFLVGSNGIEDDVPSYVKFVPLSSDSVECRKGEKPSILMNNNVQNVNMNIGERKDERTQWLLVAEKVMEDLVLAYERVKTEMKEHHHVSRLVARFGKIFFYGSQAGPVAECSLKNLNKMFSTDLPMSYLQHIKSNVVPSHGFSIDKEKETYTVKVSHYSRPNATINCKCTRKEDGRLKSDMRLMLTAKREITYLSDKEIGDIKALLESATVDPNVKGGLRWPFGKALSEDGYKEFEVCHVRATIYKNKTLRLRVRETDRFNETTGTGETKREVSLTLKDIDTKIQEQNTERGCVLEMLRDALGTIWDFLHCDAYLT
ncbi:hypothetical protein ISN44_As02g033520 [Arabidopsis suecica]|uniref:DUF7903 domain-containing protein n=1 Tax=Arabidopsis suecica TaxID=45249 RepID=A0A8T2G4F5_ARASU|nr:hypothetical protein ISN44_As02g033520 [Arabidopsis suecica]